MIKRHIPLYYTGIGLLAGMVLSYLIMQAHYRNINHLASNIASALTGKECDFNFERLQGYKYIKPLVWVRPVCESDKYSALKQQLADLIQSYIRSGVLTSASFDLRDLKGADWVSYNSQETFSPGSLMKVQVMITVLRMAEDKKGLLDQEIFFDQPFHRNTVPFFPDITIKPGNKYTVRQLLQRMIQYSDNDAKDLLLSNIDTVAFKKSFSDFGFPEFQRYKPYPITAGQFSAYMEMLYNAGYLTIDDSEFATALLTTCTFKQGMVKGLPDSLTVAHKFGESEDPGSEQFHESGIVYYDASPYLLTVMTKGPDISRLPDVVSMISQVVYNHITTANKLAQTVGEPQTDAAIAAGK